MPMTKEEIAKHIQKLESVSYEWACLIPRLSPTFRKNAEECKRLTDEVANDLRKQTTPYPEFCRHPKKCQGKGACQADFCCAD